MTTRSRQSIGREAGPPALWDPAGAWPSARIWIWAALAVVVAIAQGPAVLGSFRVTWREGNDFFQDWCSARNVLEGRPAYRPHSEAISRYFPREEGVPPPMAYIPWNAHPPTSVLTTLPLGLLDYPAAGTLWNVLGFIALVAALSLTLRELEIPLAAWAILPIVALGLLCGPFRAQVAQGQWNAPLLLLLALAWMAERRGRPGLAGLCVGVAATLKLFPVLFLAYFAVRRRWRTVMTGCLSIALLSLATAGVLGVDSYRDYARRVLPTLDEFRSGWDNASIPAFWLKNFSSGATHYGLFAEPVVRAPGLARAGIVASCLSILAATLYLVGGRRPGGSEDRFHGDYGFALTMTAMLLLTPICWDHYLLLLALPLALLWLDLGPSALERFGFLILVVAVWAGPSELWRAGGVDLLRDRPDFQQVPARTYVISRPLLVPLFLSVHFYALVATYAWLAARAGGKSRRLPADRGVHDP